MVLVSSGWISKLMILNGNIFLPNFLAEQEKCFAGLELADLLTVHSQSYPQVLGVSLVKLDFRACLS